MSIIKPQLPVNLPIAQQPHHQLQQIKVADKQPHYQLKQFKKTEDLINFLQIFIYTNVDCIVIS